MEEKIVSTRQIINEIIGKTLDEIKEKTGLIMDARINDRIIKFYPEENQDLKMFNLGDIEQIVVDCLELNNKPDVLRSKTRKRSVVDARTIFTYVARRYNFTVTKIGKHMNRDHTTAIHHTQKAEDLFKTDPLFVEKYTKVINRINERYAKIVY